MFVVACTVAGETRDMTPAVVKKKTDMVSLHAIKRLRLASTLVVLSRFGYSMGRTYTELHIHNQQHA